MQITMEGNVKRKTRWAFSIAIFSLIAMLGTVHLAVSDNCTALRYVPTTHKVIAITFDDGPHPQITPQLLKILKEKQVKATFFVLGKNAAAWPNIVRQAAQEGHEIGSHAYSHDLLNKMTATDYGEELDRTNQIIRELVKEPAVFRPPGGAWNDVIAITAQLRGQATILWSIDSGDWRRPRVGKVVQTVIDRAKPGSIVLMHDGQPGLPTPEALSIIIDKLMEKGYKFVTVSELMQYYEVRH